MQIVALLVVLLVSGASAQVTWNDVTVADGDSVTGHFGDGSHAQDHLVFNVTGYSVATPAQMTVSYFLSAVEQTAAESCTIAVPSNSTAVDIWLRYDFAFALNTTSVPASTGMCSPFTSMGLIFGDQKNMSISFSFWDAAYTRLFRRRLNIVYSDKPLASVADRQIYVNGMQIPASPVIATQKINVSLGQNGQALINIAVSSTALDFIESTAMSSVVFGVVRPLPGFPEPTVMDECIKRSSSGVPAQECMILIRKQTPGALLATHYMLGEAYMGVGTVTGDATSVPWINATINLANATASFGVSGTYFSTYTNSWATNSGWFPTPKLLRDFSKDLRLVIGVAHPLYRGFTILRVVPIDISGAYVDRMFPYSYPCATNKSLEATCTSCDTTRFNSSISSDYPCGGCVTGRYGRFCEYTDQTTCSIDECHAHGSCAASRDCVCSTLPFMSGIGPVIMKTGAGCNMSFSECSVQFCNSTSYCVQNGKDAPTCACGDATVNGVSWTSADPASQCATCPVGFAQRTAGSTCSDCVRGFFGAYCNVTNASSPDAFLYSFAAHTCSGHGKLAHVTQVNVFAPPCVCDDGYTGYSCELNMTAASSLFCNNGTAIKIPTEFPDDQDQVACNCSGSGSAGFKCTAPVTDTQCSSPEWEFSTGCLRCKPGYESILTVHASNPTYTNLQQTCTQCKPGFYGGGCEYTDPVLCGSNECSGHGKCGYLPPTFNRVRLPTCICDSGWSGYNCSQSSAAAGVASCNGNGTYETSCWYSKQQCVGQCVCNAGSFGETCNLNSADCSTNYCSGIGECGSKMYSLISIDTSATTFASCGCPDHLIGAGAGSAWLGATGKYRVACGPANGTQIVCNGFGMYKQYPNHTWSCNCPASRAGYTCEFTAQECSLKLCSGQGACVFPAGASTVPGIPDLYSDVQNFNWQPPLPVCSCQRGYTGVNCALVDNSTGILTATVSAQSGTPLSTANSSGTAGVLVADFTTGITFTLDSVAVQMIQKRPVLGFRASLATVTNGTTTITFSCGAGVYDDVGTAQAGSRNISVTPTTPICIDTGNGACPDTAATGYVSIASVVAGTTSPSVLATVTSAMIARCASLVITEFDTSRELVIVSLSDTNVNALSSIGNGTNTNDTDSAGWAQGSVTSTGGVACVEQIASFTSKDGKFMYMARRNCSSTLYGNNDGFLNVFSRVVLSNGTVVNTRIATQRFYVYGFPYVWDSIQFAPNADQLFLTHTLGSFNLLPRNPTTGLFESGLISAAVLPGKFLPKNTNALIFDNSTMVGLVTYDKDSNGNDVARPLILDLTKYYRGLIQSSVMPLTLSFSKFTNTAKFSEGIASDSSANPLSPIYTPAFIPSALSTRLNVTQLALSAPVRNVTLLVVGRVVVSFEQIKDAANATTPVQYVSLMCALDPATDLSSGSAQLCTNFDYQLDPVSLTVSNVSVMFSNPLLVNTQWIVVPRVAPSSVNKPSAIYFITNTSIVVYGLSIMPGTDGPIPVSTRLQVVNLPAIDPTLTSCISGDVSTTGRVFMVACGTRIVTFKVDRKSYWLTMPLIHDTGVAIKTAAFDNSASQVIVSDKTGITYSIYDASIANDVVVDGSSASSSSSSSSSLSLAAIVGIAIGGAAFLVLVFVLYRCAKNKENALASRQNPESGSKYSEVPPDG